MSATATVPVIAIDGPGGAGKGTVSRLVAGRLGWHFLDSGALYRAAALAIERAGAMQAPPDRLGSLVAGLDIRFAATPAGEEQVALDGVDLTAAIRSEEAGKAASQIAALPAVRSALIDAQRRYRRPPGLVADGRDMGTVVFRDAGLKIYLTAGAAERARRRHKQLKDKGMDVSLAALLTDIIDRDRRDARRAVAPLKPAPDAVSIDTTGVPVDVVVEQVLTLAKQSFGSAAIT